MLVGILRGCLILVLSPLFSIALGIVIGKIHGVWYGVLGGLGMLSLFGLISVKVMNAGGRLTTADCIIPLILSVISGIIFAPVHLISASVFSTATCIGSGILLMAAMFLYKSGRMNKWGLIIPACTFIYELLPIELPTDLDNFLALGGAGVSMWLGRLKIAIASNANIKKLK